MNFNAPQLITVLIALAPVLAPAVLTFVAYVVSKLTQAQQGMLHQFAQDTVRAVEQLGAGKSNTEKKSMAVLMLANILKQYGIKSDPQLLDTLIESYVNQLPPTDHSA